MRSALRQKTRAPAQQVATGESYPAPIGGWNARDALAAMPPTDAVALENWYPLTSYLEIRGGYASHATAMTGNGKTLVLYNSLTGTNYLFCYTASGVYDVSSAGAVGASKAARTNGKHQWVEFGDGTSNYSIAVNGVDKPLYFDGTTWTAVDGVSVPALTGLVTTDIIHVNVFKGRLFFIQKNTLSFWYLAAGVAGGALTRFPLDAEFPKGGYLMAMATWTVDGGDGPDDRAVFISSEGEVVVYAGTNPSSAASWQKIGGYFIAKPLGRKCFAKMGGDLVLLTQKGAFPLSKALQSATVDYVVALSNKIENAFTEAARSYGSVFGWTPVVFPDRGALIVNVPRTEDGIHEQYVMNTITGSWTKFTGWNAEDFVVYNNNLYFTAGTVVYKAWTGAVDGVNNIVAYGKTAFSYFGRKGTMKDFKGFQPVLAVNGSIGFLADLDVDFQDKAITGNASYTALTAGVWGTSLWGVGLWGAGIEPVKNWTSPPAYPGFCAAGKIKISTNLVTVQWMACNYLFEYGGIIG